MTRYRFKPSTIEAVRWTGDNWPEIVEFGARHFIDRGGTLQLLAGKDGAQQHVPVPVGYWIVRAEGDRRDHWPVEDAYFRAKYELIDDVSDVTPIAVREYPVKIDDKETGDAAS
jgi:hypothetical protein